VGANEECGGRLQVIFDGDCGLCNRLVQWLLRRDRDRRLCFVAAGSAVGAALLAKHRRDSAEASRTILVVREASSEPGDMLARSEAVAAVLTELAPPWPLVAGVLRRIPLPVRDTGYRIVARLRYRLLGPESCRIPSAGDPRSLP